MENVDTMKCASKRGTENHLCADDIQVYISLSQSNAQESVSTLSDFLIDILFWMELSKLKLNPDNYRPYYYLY